jgi:hypothetical protein
MNYLTNYYKNLSEQLQERVNLLSRLLNERIYNPDTGEIDLVREDMWRPSDDDIMSMRKTAARMGGIPDSMVNEPLPGSSSQIHDLIRMGGALNIIKNVPSYEPQSPYPEMDKNERRSIGHNPLYRPRPYTSNINQEPPIKAKDTDKTGIGNLTYGDMKQYNLENPPQTLETDIPKFSLLNPRLNPRLPKNHDRPEFGG